MCNCDFRFGSEHSPRVCVDESRLQIWIQEKKLEDDDRGYSYQLIAGPDHATL